MEIVIRNAEPSDCQTIMEIMTSAHEAMLDQDAYITDDLPYIREHITEKGFGLMAEVDGIPAGFFVTAYPGLDENNLGRELGFSQEELLKTALMDTAAVLPRYQGLGLMGRMFSEAVRIAEQTCPYLLGTVHPENTPSRRNFEKNNFIVQKKLVKPSGSPRLLMGRFSEDKTER